MISWASESVFVICVDVVRSTNSCLSVKTDDWHTFRVKLKDFVWKWSKTVACFWTFFSSAIMNDWIMTFTSRPQMDAKRANQQWNWIRVAIYFGTPPADSMHGYLCFEPGAWIWTKGFRRLSTNCEKNHLEFFVCLNSAMLRALGWPLLGILGGFF